MRPVMIEKCRCCGSGKHWQWVQESTSRGFDILCTNCGKYYYKDKITDPTTEPE